MSRYSKRKLLPLTMLLLGSISVSSLEAPSEDKTSIFDVEDANMERIIGGTEFNQGTYPWFSIPMQGSNYYSCGGSLVAPEFILTAAHCKPNTNEDWIIGALCLNGSNCGQSSERIGTKKVYKHPNYKGSKTVNDFALVHLKSAASTAPVPLDSGPDYSKDDELWTIGFGNTKTSGSYYPTRARHVSIDYVTQGECKSAYGANKIKPSMMCAARTGKDSCQGDSGGPLYDDINNKLAGVVSWGYDCASNRYPGVYARVSDQYDWITTTICEKHSNPKPTFCDGSPPSPTPPSPTPPSPTPPTGNCPNGEVEYQLNIQTDDYGEDTYWMLKSKVGKKFKTSARGGYKPRYGSNKYIEEKECLPAGRCYKWFIGDRYKDGLCCRWGAGFYELYIGGTRVKTGTIDEGKKKEFYNFCL